MLSEKIMRFSEIENLRSKMNAVSEIVINRPQPLRQFDQIYMKTGDMILQTELSNNYLAGKDVLFMGDGDAMALTFNYLNHLGLLKGPKSSIVLDFDERILKSIQNFSREKGFENKIKTIRYNVFDSVPDNLLKSVDCFYTNPPYGASNAGESIIIFVDRCLEILKIQGSGLVILPYDNQRLWTQNAMMNIQKYICNRGLVIAEMLREVHSYHLDDDPMLKSSVMVLEKIDEIPRKYNNKPILKDTVSNFYGTNKSDVPHYIMTKD